jgi:hypothetical protein
MYTEKENLSWRSIQPPGQLELLLWVNRLSINLLQHDYLFHLEQKEEVNWILGAALVVSVLPFDNGLCSCQ